MTEPGSPLLEVLPLALAVAASPFAIIPAILVLFTPRPRATGAAFLAGWVVGVLAVTLLASTLASVVESGYESPAWAAWTRIVLGLALLALGVRKWLQRHTPQDPPKWMTAMSTVAPGRAFVLALLMAVANPKILLLAAAGGVAIGAADLSMASTITMSVAFTLIASITVALPLVLYLIRGERILDRLTRARDWLARNNAVVMSIVIVVIGLFVLAEGISGLGGSG